MSAFVAAALPWSIAVLLYLEAGRQHWRLMFLLAPASSDELLTIAVRKNAVPLFVKVIWTVFWAPILATAWLLGKAQSNTAP